MFALSPAHGLTLAIPLPFHELNHAYALVPESVGEFRRGGRQPWLGNNRIRIHLVILFKDAVRVLKSSLAFRFSVLLVAGVSSFISHEWLLIFQPIRLAAEECVRFKMKIVSWSRKIDV
jgi:hypothetical protein